MPTARCAGCFRGTILFYTIFERGSSHRPYFTVEKVGFREVGKLLSRSSVELGLLVPFMLRILVKCTWNSMYLLLLKKKKKRKFSYMGGQVIGLFLAYGSSQVRS